MAGGELRRIGRHVAGTRQLGVPQGGHVAEPLRASGGDHEIEMDILEVVSRDWKGTFRGVQVGEAGLGSDGDGVRLEVGTIQVDGNWTLASG